MSMIRATLARQSGLRLFTTSARYQKSVTDTIKDAAKSVDQTVANAAVKGIEAAGKLPASQFISNRSPSN